MDGETALRQKHGATDISHLLTYVQEWSLLHGGNTETRRQAAMFFRQKRSGDHVYLQIVENRWKRAAANNASSPLASDSGRQLGEVIRGNNLAGRTRRIGKRFRPAAW